MPRGMGNIAGGFGISVTLNQGDVMRIEAKLLGVGPRITKALWARAKGMGAQGVAMLNAAAPVGAGGDWARGDPPLSQGNRVKIATPFYAELYTVSPHARYIVLGFEPHMPPASAWLGDEAVGYPARKAVEENGTPENPRDYFTPVGEALGAVNDEYAASMAGQIF